MGAGADYDYLPGSVYECRHADLTETGTVAFAGVHRQFNSSARGDVLGINSALGSVNPSMYDMLRT